METGTAEQLSYPHEEHASGSGTDEKSTERSIGNEKGDEVFSSSASDRPCGEDAEDRNVVDVSFPTAGVPLGDEESQSLLSRNEGLGKEPLEEQGVTKVQVLSICEALVSRRFNELEKERPECFRKEMTALLAREKKILEEDKKQRRPASEYEAGVASDLHRLLREVERSEPSKEVDSEDNIECLPPDTFTYFMLKAAWCTPASIYAAVTLVLQVTTLVLVAVDKIKVEKQYNPLGVAADVDVTVRVAQVIALIIAVLTQDDMVLALNQLNDGYDGRRLQAYFPTITRQNWTVSVLCRLLVGFLALFVTWLLIVQEYTVIDIFLNFLAVSFVSQLDNVAFTLSLHGYGGRSVKGLAKTIQSTSFPVDEKVSYAESSELRRFFRFRRCYLLALVLAVMLAGWGWIVSKQKSGAFLTQSFVVQFEDDFSPALGAFAGVYDLRKGSFAGRVTYLERQSGRAMFGYCNKLKAWAFTYSNDTGVPHLDPCYAAAKSSETISYDIMETISDPWYVENEDKGELPLQHFWVSSYDCRDYDVCGEGGKCISPHGCVCNEGWFGVRCEFPLPCTILQTDERFSGFLGTRQWSTQFTILKFDNGTAALVYSRPVYISRAEQVYDIVLFTGRRWVVTHSGLLSDFQSVWRPRNNSTSATSSLPKLLAEYLVKHFHAYWSKYSVTFVSEAIDVATPNDAATPVGIRWFHAKTASNEDEAISVDAIRDIQATFLCAICDNETNPCFFDSICQRDGVCDCVTGASGTLCQAPPNGNGLCNDFFNNPEFQYDGGDCCQATCVSNGENTCGVDRSGSGLLGYVGFNKCTDPQNVCDSCWKQLTNVIHSQATHVAFHSLTGVGSKYMALSRDGRMLAVSDGLSSQGVQVYYLEGATWVQRGNILQDRRNLYFGISVAISDLGHVVAIGGPDNDNPGLVQVFEWGGLGWIQRGQDLFGNKNGDFFGISVSLSGDGKYLAVGATDVFTGQRGYVKTFSYAKQEGGVSEWQIIGSDEGYIFGDSKGDYFGTSVALSSDGIILFAGNRFGTTSLQAFRRSETGWEPMGGDIAPENLFFACFGCAIAISEAGTVVAVGSPQEDVPSLRSGSVRVYAWDGSEWKQKGAVVRGHAEGVQLGHSVSLSADGTLLAIGVNTPSESDAMIQILSWDDAENQWTPLGDSIPGGSGNQVALSGDGNSVATTVLQNDIADVLQTNLYEYISSPLRCDEGNTLLRISLRTDAVGSDVKWYLRDANKTVMSEGGPYLNELSTSLIEEMCVPRDECYTFQMYNYGGNGICCQNGHGAYIIWLDSIEVASGGDFNWYDEVLLGKCDPRCSDGTSLFRMELMLDKYGSETEWSLCDDSGEIVMKGGPYPDNTPGIVVEQTCVDANVCGTFKMSEVCEGLGFKLNPECGLGFEGDTSGYRITLDEKEIGNSYQFKLDRKHPVGNCPPPCAEGLSLLRFLLKTDQKGNEVTWHIKNDAGESLLEGGPYSFMLVATVAEEVCIDAINTCTTLVIEDSGGDGIFGDLWGVGGYAVILDGEEIVLGLTYEYSVAHRIGRCGPTLAPTSSVPTTSPTDAPTVSLIPTLSPARPTVFPTTFPTISYEPTVSPTIVPSRGACTNGTHYLQVSIVHDSLGSETTWQLSNEAEEVLLQGGPYADGFTFDNQFTYGTCIDPTSCFTFTMFDSGGNGFLFGLGGYIISLDDEEIIRGGSNLLDTESVLIGEKCDRPATIAPTAAPTRTACPGETQYLDITIIHDIYGSETTWTLTNDANEVILQGGPYEDFSLSPQFTYEICIDPGKCFTFKINDASGDGFWLGLGGYIIALNGEEIVNGGTDLTDTESVDIGSCDLPAKAPTPAPAAELASVAASTESPAPIILPFLDSPDLGETP